MSTKDIIDALNEIAAQDRRNFPPHGGAITALVRRAIRIANGAQPYDPTTQPFDEPFRHVDTDTISSEMMAYVIDENSILPIIQWLIDRDQMDAADAVRGLMAREHNAHLAVKEERAIADSAKAEVRALMDKCDNFERSTLAGWRRAVEAEERLATTIDELMQSNARIEQLRSIAKRWAALDGVDWHQERHAAEKIELLADTQAAIADAEGRL